MLNQTSILVTGGTGSFGKKFVEMILKQYPQVSRLVVFSRDELKQYEMAQDFSPREYPQLRYFLGDVRDIHRVRRALEGIDVVIHAAALKQVPTAEYNPFEFIKTNIMGAQNVIEASLDRGVKRVIALSTDKAAAPINLYGATKLCSDKLFVAANNHKGSRDLKFSVVRYGNVFASRGSVVPLFLKQKPSGSITVTDKGMTRFTLTLEQGVNMVLKALDVMRGGEIFVPKIPSYRILDLVQAVAPECRIVEVGMRQGEKLHEEMITPTDAMNSLEFDDYYVIYPSAPRESAGGTRCESNFHYRSDNNQEWLTVSQLKELVVSYEKSHGRN